MSQLITKYFPNLTELQISQYNQLLPLYTHWNEQINVISRKDIEQFYERHVLHSLGIAKVVTFENNTRIFDVGTGGGFPGIPLAIMFPECKFTLVDSIGKKIKVVQEVATALGLENVTILNQRAEEIKTQFDFIVSRAVTRITPFYGWVKNNISGEQRNPLQNGILYLKGGDLNEELGELVERYPKLVADTYPLPDFFTEDFFETKTVLHVWK
jgi:16S rRNA (guanine527-N7)-methyltransferase